MPKLNASGEKILKLVRGIEHNTIDKIIDMDELFNTRFVGTTLININETWFAISADRLIEES